MNVEEIKIFLSKLPISRSVEIVHIHECGLVALNKKAGVLSHPNPKQADNAKKSKETGSSKNVKTLLRCPYNFNKEYYSFKTEEGENLRLHLINRLDSHTSGLILVATNEEVAKIARLAFKNHEVQKEYLAVCLGRPMLKKGILKDFIKTTNSNNKFVRSSIENIQGKFNALCEYNLIKTDTNRLNLSLLSLKPTTGKTHQLRIQCANKQIPIYGDATYGNFTKNRELKRKTKIDRLCLHCKNISMNILLDDKKINFEATAPMPKTFTSLIEHSPSIILNKR